MSMLQGVENKPDNLSNSNDSSHFQENTIGGLENSI